MYDGPQIEGSGEIFDLDHTTSLTTLSAHWRGFSDPHTGISEYFWSIGSCAGCSNVQGFTSVGVATGRSTSTAWRLQAMAEILDCVSSLHNKTETVPVNWFGAATTVGLSRL